MAPAFVFKLFDVSAEVGTSPRAREADRYSNELVPT
jgi:hypothetical protein